MKTLINENDDPRVMLDAFVALVRKKDFTSISVKDITKYAQVNRATFYAHFQDKYDILEYMVIDTFMNLISKRINVEPKFCGGPLYLSGVKSSLYFLNRLVP